MIKFLIQENAEHNDDFPKSSPSFKYVVNEKENIKGECIPFPPFTISNNFEIYTFLASIFAPLISEKQYSDVKDSLLLNWIYSFKINYPRKPNIFDFILGLGFNPGEDLDVQNPATFRFVIHQFCKAFGDEAKIKVKDLSMAIPKNDVLSIHVDDDILAFVPIITPISSFSIDPPETEVKSKIKFLFPTTITATVPKNDKTKTKSEQTGPAFANKNENSNDNENANDNNNSNDNDNTNANSDENMANNNDKTDQKITFNFYGGLFESCQKPLKYILVKIDDKYYKYSCSAEPQDYYNGIEIINPASLNETMEIRDYCVATFFLKDGTSLHPYIYQKI